MAHRREEATLRGTRPLRFETSLVDGLLLQLAVGDIAHHRHDLKSVRAGDGCAIERPAAHLHPDERPARRCRAVARLLAAHPKLDRARVTVRRVGERREIGRPVTDMNTVEHSAPPVLSTAGTA